jgi:hypothetical protein
MDINQERTRSTIDKLRALENAATPGPWAWHRRNDPDAPASIHMVHENYAIAMSPRYGMDKFPKNAEFITAARNHWSALLDVVKAADEMADATEFIDGDPDVFWMAVADFRVRRSALDTLGSAS